MEANGIDPLVGVVLERRYLLMQRIAHGGMASVYRALDQRLDRLVAVKVLDMERIAASSNISELSPEDAETIAASFQHEAKTTARLNHPNVVGVFDHGVHDGLPFLVMEYVPGHTLRHLLATHGRLEPAAALEIFEPILDALSAAHRAGLAHRDVKPENVLISATGAVKVVDFGLARAVKPGQYAAEENLLVTVAYVAPEQVTQGWSDVRSDVYSAGIMLYELLTGALPYRADSPMDVAYQHVERNVPAPSEMVPGLPSALDDLVRHATRRQHHARLPHAEAFAARLRTVRATLASSDEKPGSAVAVSSGVAPGSGIADGSAVAAGPGATTGPGGGTGSAGATGAGVAATVEAAATLSSAKPSPAPSEAGSPPATIEPATTGPVATRRFRRKHLALAALCGVAVVLALVLVSVVSPTSDESPAAPVGQRSTSPSPTPSRNPTTTSPSPTKSATPTRSPRPTSRGESGRSPETGTKAPPTYPRNCPSEFSDEWWYDYCTSPPPN